jgi:hypothetical protein
MVEGGVGGDDSGDAILLRRRDDLFEVGQGKIGRNF